MDELQKRLEDKQTQATPLVTGYFQGGPGYATGSADTSDKDVYDAPAAFGSAAKRTSGLTW